MPLLTTVYTECPHCRTTFSITARQLRAARGAARCGRCLRVFDAVAHLSEEALLVRSPAKAPEPPKPSSTGSAEDRSSAGRDARARTDASPGEGASKRADAAREAGAGAKESTASPDAPRAGGSASEAASEPGSEAATGSASESASESPGGSPAKAHAAGKDVPVLDRRADEGVPEMLRDDLAKLRAGRRRAGSPALYGLGSAVLLVALAAQYAWFMPEDVAQRYPAARAWLGAFCEASGCTLPGRRDTSQIRVLSRDVRVHPKYEGALLVSATLENTAAYTQPYPRMQFSLYNVNGQLIAARRFQPREYLSPDVNVEAGMAPETPVQVVLDMLAPEQAAVSFEFRFL